MRLYLAGPMRSIPQFNHPAFHEGTRLLRAAGHEVFSPAEHDRDAGLDVTGMTGDQDEHEKAGFSLRELLGADLAWICAEADAVIVLPSWEASRGSQAEVATATALSLPVWELAEFLQYGPGGNQVNGVDAK